MCEKIPMKFLRFLYISIKYTKINIKNMKAIILASGRGTRMKPLTDTTPKPMIKIAWKPMIEHNIEKIYEGVDEIIIVVKYLSEQFKSYFWDDYKGTKITYHIQGEEKGTGAALWGIDVREDIILLYGDSIFEKSDLDLILNLDGYGCLVKRVENPEKYGVYIQKQDGTAEKVIEKPSEDYGNLTNVWVYKLSQTIFALVDQIEISERWEYELTDAVNLFCESEKFQLIEMKWAFIDIGCPSDIAKAESILQSKFYTKPILWKTTLIKNFGEYSLHLWIPENQIDRLIKYSLDLTDEELQKNTWDENRFSNMSQLSKWYADEKRLLITMLDKTGILAWIYWGRFAKVPNVNEIIDQDLYDIMLENIDNIHTNAIRIYPQYRGKWLAKILFQAEDFYESLFEKCFWSTDIGQENIASCKGFERSGYVHMANGKNVNNWRTEDSNRRIYAKFSQK